VRPPGYNARTDTREFAIGCAGVITPETVGDGSLHSCMAAMSSRGLPAPWHLSARRRLYLTKTYQHPRTLSCQV